MSMWGMMASAIDLRHKILPACERRLGAQRALADLFGVSLSCVEKLLRRHRATGDIAPKPHAGGQRSSLDAAAHARVQQLVHANSDMTFEELCARVAAERGVHVSVATMCRLLQRLGLPRKKSRSTPASAIPHASGKRARTTASASRRLPSGA